MTADLVFFFLVFAGIGFLVLRAMARQARRSAKRMGRHLERRLVDAALVAVGLGVFTRRGRGSAGRRQPVRPPPPGQWPVEPGGPTVLYRHFNTAGRVLYIGITDAGRGGQRWHEHADDKPWFHEVARSEVSHPYPTRADALYAEAVAIRDEKPLYNICRPDPARIGRRRIGA